MKRALISLLVTAALLLSLLPAALPRAQAADPEPSVALSLTGDRLTAAYNGAAGSSARLIAAGYEESGIMRTVQADDCRSGASVTFSYNDSLNYRVFALDPVTDAPLCEAASEISVFSGRVDVPYIDGATADAVSVAVRQSLDARIALEQVLALDPADVYQNKDKLTAYLAVVDQAMAAYDELMTTGAVLCSVAGAEAEDQQDRLSALLADRSAALQGDAEEAVHWAEELTRQYDAIEGNKKLASLGEMMGCDARTAYQQLVIAQEILRRGYDTEIASDNAWIKGLTFVKTGCKVTMFVGSVILTGGASGVVTAGEAVGLMVGATDVSIEVTKTGCTLLFGDDGNVTQRFSDATAPISAGTYIYSLLTLDPDKLTKGEVIACLGDYYENVKDNYGKIIDFLKDFRMDDGGNLTGEVSSMLEPPARIEELIDDGQGGGSGQEPGGSGEEPGSGKPDPGGPDLEDLTKTKDSLDSEENGSNGRKPISDDSLETILKDGDVLDDGEDIKDFKDNQLKDFKKDIRKKQTEDKPDPEGSGGSESGGSEEGGSGSRTPTGLYEYFYYSDALGEDILAEQRFYDGSGTILWDAHYDYETGGRLKDYSTYTNGEKPGSFRYLTTYYYKDADLAEASVDQPVRSREIHQWQEGVPGQYDGWIPYYGEWYTYRASGTLLNHHIGDESILGTTATPWKSETYDERNGQADLWYDNVWSPDGTLTSTEYYSSFTSVTQDFSTLGHPWSRTTTYPNSTGPLTIETWTVDAWNERAVDWDSEGNPTAYEADVGYRHDVDHYAPDADNPSSTDTDYIYMKTIRY